jgi:hypothetical protein
VDSYDVLFSTGDGRVTWRAYAQSAQDEDAPPEPDRPADGWIGGAGPAIDPATWPRGPLTGLPMFHAITLRLPLEYRRQGPELPGIAFFQGEGQFAEQREVDPDDPFEADLARCRPHPRLNLREDIIDGRFALLWLTEAELAAGPTAPPADPRRPGEHPADDEGPNAWDSHAATRRVWLTPRPDPNAGVAPVRAPQPQDAYQDPVDRDTYDLRPWAAALFARCHLGGTAFPVQELPDGLTPWFLELEEFGELNFGGGNAQIDLESDTFDWACG